MAVERDGVNDVAPAIVVVRDPEFEDTIMLYAIEAEVVYIDLGSDFNRTPDSREQFDEWAAALRERVELPVGHPAWVEIEATIAAVEERVE